MTGTQLATEEVSQAATKWPTKHDVFGIGISATTYDDTIRAATEAVRNGTPAIITALAVHGLVSGTNDPEFREVLNDFDVVTPDGQPVRFALNVLHHAGLPDRVYGPELTRRLCEHAANQGIGIYLYGSYPHVVAALARSLLRKHPQLIISGYEPSLFRPLSPEEDTALVDRINESGAGFVFIGLGCPRQEQFAHQHRNSINSVQLCVGAAFDFLAGNKSMAPSWMQRSGLEWLFRLVQEPRRLWRRYAYTNAAFVMKLCGQLIGRRTSSSHG